MTDDIRVLREALEKVQQGAADINLGLACTPDRISRLLAHVEALERDAKRYLQLRNRDRQERRRMHGIHVVDYESCDEGTILYSYELDACLDRQIGDAAINSGEKG